ncbi:MAG: FecR domain-containing protein [Candidatus Sericytochromatia bacterium]|nr:FecR domain-containing protein [Candidatus Sericytochromatia bacterium]
MKLKFFSLISISLLGAFAVQNYLPAKTIQVQAKSYARITKVVGQVKILKNKDWINLNKNVIVKVNDHLKTYQKSRTELTFSDGSRIRLDENTDIVLIKTKTLENNFFKLFGGHIWANIANRGKGRFAMQSSTAALAVMGTIFDVGTQNNKTEVSVFEGSVGVQLPSKTIEDLDKGLNNLKLSVDDNRNKISSKPQIISKPVEVEKPYKLIDGPHQVSREKWLEVVENQKITIDNNSVGTVSELSKNEINNEWVQWNKNIDSNKPENVTFNK